MAQSIGPRCIGIGKTQIPLLGLGTYQATDGKEVYDMLDVALRTGYRLIDTAGAYNNEAFIGDAFKTLLPHHNLSRRDLFIVSKIKGSDLGASVSHDAIRKSVADLHPEGNGYVDLMLVHYPGRTFDDPDPICKKLRLETWTELIKAKTEGLVRAIGVSNFEISHLEHLKANSPTDAWPPAVNQIELHPHFSRKELVRYCQDHGIGVMAYSSLGRMHADLITEPIVENIASSHGVSVSDVLLRWAYQQSFITIPKSSNPNRLASNWNGCLSVTLSTEEIEKLNGLNRNQNYTKCTPWVVP